MLVISKQILFSSFCLLLWLVIVYWCKFPLFPAVGPAHSPLYLSIPYPYPICFWISAEIFLLALFPFSCGQHYPAIIWMPLLGPRKCHRATLLLYKSFPAVWKVCKSPTRQASGWNLFHYGEMDNHFPPWMRCSRFIVLTQPASFCGGGKVRSGQGL